MCIIPVDQKLIGHTGKKVLRLHRLDERKMSNYEIDIIEKKNDPC